MQSLHFADMGIQPPKTPGWFSLRLDVEVLPQVLQTNGCFYHSPLPPILFEPCKQQGLFAPRKLLRFFATVDPSDSLSSSTAFPVFPVIWLPASAHFWNGTRRVSPVAWCVLVIVLSL